MDFSDSALDLTAASTRGADCHVEHPFTGEPLYYTAGHENGDETKPIKKPIVIRVLGQDSREFRGMVSANSEVARTRKKPLTVEEAETKAIEMLSALVVSWEGIEWEGAPLKCTIENVEMFLRKFPPIRTQLDQFIADRANFFGGRGKK